ncbi:hypothetical protein [Nicoliella lavandulae]|uniref:Surface layer protein A domain-containing protein n=1 Tax=Nicoliella lavandulae TaxID=3082954 RepID=A0ABU8SJ58_9LACO
MQIKSLLLSMATAAVISVSMAQVTAQANGYQYAQEATRSVRVIKRVPVYRGTAGPYEAANRFKLAGYIKPGTHLKVSQYFMSTGGYIVKNHKYTATTKRFYIVPKDNSSWFE